MSDALTPFAAPAAPALPRSRFADQTAPSWFPAAVVAAGTLAALLLVDHRPGIGVPLTVAVAAAAALPAVRVRRADWPLAALGGALALMPALRDAEWLVALDLLAIAALGCLAVVGVRDWRSIAAAALAVPARVFPAPAFVARALPRGAGLGPVLRGVLIAGPLVVVFGALFASADAAFGELLSGVVPTSDVLVGRVVTFCFVTLALAALVLAHRVPVELPPAPEPRPLRGPEWVVPLVALDLLFAAFVAVQVAVLFGGHEHVLETTGLTYAEYARSGFFQLIAVTALTFGVVAGAVRWAPPGRLSRVLTGLLLALDAVVLVSALRRLALYESVFGLSVDRVLAHTVALWLAVVLVLVVVAGVTRRSTWLPRAVVGSAAGALLVLNVANPEALIARSQVERYERTGDLDALYLGGLSADAVPELAGLPEPARGCVLQQYAVEDDAWPGFNVARERARSLLPEGGGPLGPERRAGAGRAVC